MTCALGLDKAWRRYDVGFGYLACMGEGVGESYKKYESHIKKPF